MNEGLLDKLIEYFNEHNELYKSEIHSVLREREKIIEELKEEIESFNSEQIYDHTNTINQIIRWTSNWWENKKKNSSALEIFKLNIIALKYIDEKIDELTRLDEYSLPLVVDNKKNYSYGPGWWRLNFHNGKYASGRITDDSSWPFNNINLLEKRSLKDKVIEQRGTINRPETLKIGLFSLEGDFRTYFKSTKVQSSEDGSRDIYFQAYQVADSINLENHLVKCIKWIKKEKITHAIFPELSIDDTALIALKKAINDIAPHYLQAVIAGSFHRPIGSTYANQATVWLVSKGKVQDPAYFYNKEQQYNEKKIDPHSNELIEGIEGILNLNVHASLIEDISYDNDILIIKSSKYGSWGILICKDAFRTEYISYKKYIGVVDYIFIISMNVNSRTKFLDKSIELSNIKSIATFYLNTADNYFQINPEVNNRYEKVYLSLPRNLTKALPRELMLSSDKREYNKVIKNLGKINSDNFRFLINKQLGAYCVSIKLKDIKL